MNVWHTSAPDESAVVNPKIEEAGRWLASMAPEQRPRPIVPELRKRFGLTAKEACAAIREATLAHGRAH